MKGKLSKLPRAEQWADRICTQLGKSVESIIDVGRLLVKAKADLAHGEWLRLFADKLVPFGPRTAQMLIVVAEHPSISNTKHASYLPPAWTSLYELTKVEPKRLSAAFKDGIISPDMTRSDVKALLPAKAVPLHGDDEDVFDERSAIVKVIHSIRSIVALWPASSTIDPLINQLRLEATRLEQREEERRAS